MCRFQMCGCADEDAFKVKNLNFAVEVFFVNKF